MKGLLIAIVLACFVALPASAAPKPNGPCGLFLNTRHLGQPAFRTPAGGHALRRLLAGRFLLCTLKRRDGTLFAKLHSDHDGRVLGLAFYRRNGRLRSAIDASYASIAQAPAEVSCGNDKRVELGPGRWKAARKWWIGTTAPGLSADAVVKAVRAAQSEWTNNINYCGIPDYANPPSSYQGRSSSNALAHDGKSVIGWGSLSGLQGCETALACTVSAYDTKGQPVETDIRFSTNFKWSTTGKAGTVDIQTIAAHEIGHALQFDHVTTGKNAALMWPYFTSGDTSGRKLGKGEALGDNNAY